MQARHSWTPCCSSWILAKSMCETFGFLVKRTLYWKTSSISKTDTFEGQRILVLPYHHSCTPKSHSLGRNIMQMTYWAIFTEPNDCCRALLGHSVWICGSTKYLEGLCVIVLDYSKHSGSNMDWPPYLPDLTPCDFFSGGTWKTRGAAKILQRRPNWKSTSLLHVRAFWL